MSLSKDEYINLKLEQGTHHYHLNNDLRTSSHRKTQSVL